MKFNLLSGTTDDGYVWAKVSTSKNSFAVEFPGVAPLGRVLRNHKADLNEVWLGPTNQTVLRPRFRPEHPFLTDMGDPEFYGQALQQAAGLLNRLGEPPTLNHPAAVLATRQDRLFQCVDGTAGVVGPRVVRFCPASRRDVISAVEQHQLSWPVVLSPARRHRDLADVILRDADAPLDAAPLDGREFILTEAPPNGEAVRAAFVGDQMFVLSERLDASSSAAATLQDAARAIGLDYVVLDAVVVDDGVRLCSASAAVDVFANEAVGPAAQAALCDLAAQSARWRGAPVGAVA